MTGWDAYRERVFARQKDTRLDSAGHEADASRADTMAPLGQHSRIAERPFSARLMEVFAGFVEHADAQAGKAHRRARRDSAFATTPSSSTSSATTARAPKARTAASANCSRKTMIPNTIEQQIAALNKIGGLDALGGPKVDNMYHAGWAWAGDTPFRYTKLVASHFGGTRNPLVVSWPKRIKPDKTPRPQFHHVNDIAPTLYEIIGIKPPDVVDGFKQDPIDGVSMAYSFADASSTAAKNYPVFREQRQSRHLSRRLVRRTLRTADAMADGEPGLATWDANERRLGTLRSR